MGDLPWKSPKFLERIWEPKFARVVRWSVQMDLRNAGHLKGSNMRKLVSTFASFAVLGLLTLTSTALADDKKAPAAGGDKGGKVKVYDFSGDTIEGDLIKPEGSTVDARDFAKHSSLIKIRTNFVAEIIKSAEDL